MPGFIPTFRIYKGGEDITNRFQDRATEIKVELASGNGAQDTCSITVDDRDWLVARPQVDDYLDIYLGYEGVGVTYMGTFEVDEVHFLFPPKAITVHGNSQGSNSILKCPEIKQYDGKTVKEILEEIGQKSGLQVNVHPSFADKKINFKNSSSSAQHLITQLEKQYGAVAKISNQRLSFIPKDKGQSASGDDLPLLVLRAEHFADCNVKHTNRSDYTKTKASYTDKDTNKRVDVESETSVNGLPGNAPKERPYLIDQLFASKDEAEAAAKSQMQALDRNLGEGFFTLAEGDPWVRDQQRILVAGTRDGIDGSYVVDIVTHTFTKNGGLRTAIKAMPPEGGNNYASIYAQAPTKALTPKPGQVTGQVLNNTETKK